MHWHNGALCRALYSQLPLARPPPTTSSAANCVHHRLPGRLETRDPGLRLAVLFVMHLDAPQTGRSLRVCQQVVWPVSGRSPPPSPGPVQFVLTMALTVLCLKRPPFSPLLLAWLP